MQKARLGRSEGAMLQFNLCHASEAGSTSAKQPVEVFTTRADTLFGVQYVGLSLDHPLVQSLALEDEQLQGFIDQARHLDPDNKAGYRLQGMSALNPLAKVVPKIGAVAEVPIFAAPYVKSDYASGAVMGVPAHDSRDFSFWQQNNDGQEHPRFVIIPESVGDKMALPMTQTPFRRLRLQDICPNTATNTQS